MPETLSISGVSMKKTPTDLDDSIASKKLYFVNEIVEWDLTEYIWTGCTDVVIRDRIMENAPELIRQIIRKQGLYNIYPGQEESSFGDLVNTAWMQLERTLYKYRSRPYCRLCYRPDRPSESILYDPQPTEYGILTFDQVIDMHNGSCPKCGGTLEGDSFIPPEQGRFGGSESILYRGISKVFNMWSQVTRTVILAYIKKEGRDRRNTNGYKNHLDSKRKREEDVLIRFIDEARDVCEYSDDYIMLVDALEYLISNDERPYDGIISKLTSHTKLPRVVVSNFMKYLKLQSYSFTDSLVNRPSESKGPVKSNNVEIDEDN